MVLVAPASSVPSLTGPINSAAETNCASGRDEIIGDEPLASPREVGRRDAMYEVGQEVELSMDEVYARRHGKMTRFARKKLRGMHVPETFVSPEDVVQDAFAKAYRNPSPIEQPQAYLFRIITREIQNHARRASQYAQPPAESQADIRVAIDDAGEVISDRRDVHRAQATLPAQQSAAGWATEALNCTQADSAGGVDRKPGGARAVAGLKATLTVSAALASVLLCAAGSTTIHRYSAASRNGQPQPQLMPDMPQPAIYGLWATAVVYGLMLLFMLAHRPLLRTGARARRPDWGDPGR
ncbi:MULTISPECIES: RNA polymerase sigma factor [unclassified Streptomyces]|uniref:RNA polymerase sigma factor n=1 Tax=unclassified Streptomyces TaxID=2593676 RepID=UPI00131CA791|nr:sigma factor [Streptomyces sp. NRRL F-5122]